MAKVARQMLLTFFLFGSLPLYSQTKIAFVDMKKVYEIFLEAQNVKEELNKKKEKLVKSAESKRKRIETMKNRLDTQKGAMTPEETQNRLKEIDFLEDEFKVFIFDLKEELRADEELMTRKVVKSIYQQIRKICRRQKYDLVLDKSRHMMLYDQENDLTEELLERIEERKQAASFN